MKHLILLIIAGLFASVVAAQPVATLSGKVTVAKDEVAAFSPVLLFAQTATTPLLVQSVLTDEAGSFVFTPGDSGVYVLEIRVSGYQKLVSQAIYFSGKESLVLDDLQVNAAETATVEISATKPLLEVRADMLVLNVAGSILATGADAWSLLRKAPGVNVDPNDNLSLKGQPGVAIWLDGRPSPVSGADLAQWLKNLPADAIESIEIITQPSAKYDAAGGAGIINIVLKKGVRPGRTGNVTTGWAVGKFPKYNLSADFGQKNTKTSLFAQYSLNHATDWSYIRLNRQQAGLQLNQYATTISHPTSQNFRLAGTWSPSEASQFGFLLNGNITQSTAHNSSTTPITEVATGTLLATLRAFSDQESFRYNVNSNLNYEFRPGKQFSFTVNADYGRYVRDNQSYQPNTYYAADGQTVLSSSLFSIQTPALISIASLKTDLTSSLGGGTLSYGAKFSAVSTDNDFGFLDWQNEVWTKNAERSNRFTYEEKIAAAYAQWKGKLKEYDVQAGLRAEQTLGLGLLESAQPNTDNRFVRQYLNFFPSAGISRSFGQNHQAGISYSRRIDRPAYQELNPFQSKLDELSYSSGNPYLLPEFTHKIEVYHTYRYSISSSLSYNFTKNVTVQLTDTTEGSRSFIRPENLAQQQGLSLNFSAPWSPRKGWDLYGSFTGSWSAFKGEFAPGKGIDLAAFSGNVYAQSVVQLGKTASVEVSGFFSTPGIWGGTYRSRKFWGMDIGAKKSFWNERLTARVVVTDVFWGMQWGGQSQFGGLNIDAGGGWESRLLRVSLSAQLGDRNARQRKGKSGMDEEAGRVY